jgi:hypothetical protein
MGWYVFHIQILFEIMDVLLHIAKFDRLFFPFAPTGWFKRAQHKIFIVVLPILCVQFITS